MDERVLVLCGKSRSSLEIFDRAGTKIGSADRTSAKLRAAGSSYQYDVRDSEVRLRVRATTARKLWFESLHQTHSVLSPDGNEIATLSKSVLRRRFTIASRGKAVARFRKATWAEAHRQADAALAPTAMQRIRQSFFELNHHIPTVCIIESEAGEVTARITSVGDNLGRVNYVCELQEPIAEAAIPTALAACIATDNMILQGGIGGA
jgi:hypothetical protein